MTMTKREKETKMTKNMMIVKEKVRETDRQTSRDTGRLTYVNAIKKAK